MSELNTFSNSSGLKPVSQNLKMRVLNGDQVALCGVKCVNLNKKTAKILDVRFSYNKNLQQDKNSSKHFVKIENKIKL